MYVVKNQDMPYLVNTIDTKVALEYHCGHHSNKQGQWERGNTNSLKLCNFS